MASRLRQVQAVCYRAPLARPVVTSFGRMVDRPAVFCRLTDEDGIVGWGEAWCNFPSVGAEHRARLINDLLGPMILGQDLATPGSLYHDLSRRLAVLAIQSGEPGPLAQSIAAIDTAHWDLAARRAGQPLWRMLGGARRTIPVYASGINPTESGATAALAARAGHRAFKLKIGFEPERDLANIAEIRREVGDRPLAVDANQAWSPAEAEVRLPALADQGLAWLEEPLRADMPWAAWSPLVGPGTPPLAAGENIASASAFEAAFEAGILSVIQPDLAKWGGLTGTLPVARAALAAGRRFCPHYLGAGIGLLASAHLLAAIGGDGSLEVDVNPNPLRDLCCGPVGTVSEGSITLGEAPGLGAAPDLDALAPWRTL